MAINPMQRKARNSFLLGFLLALIIGAIISYFLYTKMSMIQKAFDKVDESRSYVYVAMEDLKSGDEIILDEDSNPIDEFAINDEKSQNGLIGKSLITEREEENNNNNKNENVNEDVKLLQRRRLQTTLSSDKLINRNMFTYEYHESTNDKSDDSDGYTRVYKKLIMKIDVPAGTIITKDMVETVDDKKTDDQRLQE